MSPRPVDGSIVELALLLAAGWVALYALSFVLWLVSCGLFLALRGIGWALGLL